MNLTTDQVTETIDTLFGDSIKWDDSNQGVGYIPCPGAHKHTGNTADRDCRIYLDGVPNAFCVHQSCKADVDELTENVRGALKAAGWEPPPMTAEMKDRSTSKGNNRRTADRLGEDTTREFIFANNAWSTEQIVDDKANGIVNGFERVGKPAFVEFLTGMFGDYDTAWIGEPHQSGSPEFAKHFRPVWHWLYHAPELLAPFICPNPFEQGETTRSTKTLTEKKYFIIEGDTCHPDPDINRDRCGALFAFAIAQHPSLKLRAIVDAGNKSLHGWFEYPSEEVYRWCLEVLPALGADPATMRLAQPVRLPGARRSNGKEQRLLWISK